MSTAKMLVVTIAISVAITSVVTIGALWFGTVVAPSQVECIQP